MEFGKLSNVDEVDFSLPPIDRRGDLQTAPAHTARVMIGTPAWGESRWLGRVYPVGAKPSEFLAHYARQFETIELNSTFYGTPSAQTLRKWRLQTPKTFRFCPKVPRAASHALSSAKSIVTLREFAERIALLDDRLGTCFLQLPPELGPHQRVQVADLLDAWPAPLELGVEFRHPGWFRGGALIDSARQMLADRGVGTVITDVAGRRDVCHATLTAPFVLVRLVGNALHPSDAARSQAWGERLAQWLRTGLAKAYFFAHQPDNVLAPELATLLTRAVNRSTALSLRGWRPAPRQMNLL